MEFRDGEVVCTGYRKETGRSAGRLQPGGDGQADVARPVETVRRLSADPAFSGGADDALDLGSGYDRCRRLRSGARPDVSLRPSSGLVAGQNLCRIVSRDASLDPALSDFLRIAQYRDQAFADRGCSPRAGAELCGLRSGELPGGDSIDSARTDGSGALAGNDA